ncbi:hypothetical protein MHU86_10698 [Fragilaria crotonensis]|nr:hypothetical protein MHU86_10698 [Fragilaria crotonensis]
MIPLKQFEDSVKNRMSNSLVLHNGSCKCAFTSTKTQPIPDQHRYVLNTLQRYDPNSEFPERDTPFRQTTPSAKKTVLSQNKTLHLLHKSSNDSLSLRRLHSLYLAYNTRADILFAVCKLAKACIAPGILDSPSSPGSSATYAAVPTMHSSSTLIAHPILSMRSAYNIASPMLILLFSLMPAGKTAQTLAAQPLAT